MLPVTDKEERNKNYLKLAQIHTAIQKREHEQRRKMVLKNILQKEGDINYKIPTTAYLKSFKPNLIGCSALHLAFNAGKSDIFNDILHHDADPIMKYNDVTVIHRAIEENFTKRETSKLVKKFNQYTKSNFTTQDTNSFIVMSKNIEKKNFDETKNWRLRSQLEDPFVDSILSAQIEHNNSLNPYSQYGLSHFHVACMANNHRAVKFFLENGVDVNEAVKIDSPLYSGYRPIHFAVRCSGLETVQELLKYKVNVNEKDGERRSPLEILIDHNIKIREWIKMHKKLPYENSIVDYIKNEKIINLLIDSLDSNNQVEPLCLYASCTLRSTTKAERLLKKITNINHADDNLSMWPGYTALHFAAFFNMEIVKLLLKNGADIDAKDENGISPLDILLKHVSITDLHFILSVKEEWKNIVLSDGKTQLLDLILSMENLEKFEKFLKTTKVDSFVPLDCKIWPGYTILHLAVMFSETSKITKFLTNDSTDINYEAELEKCCQEQKEIYHQRISVCLSMNSNILTQDVRNLTPIHLAFRQREPDTIKFLLQQIKHFKNIVDADNLSLLHIACAYGCRELVKQLIPSKAATEHLNKPVLPTFKWNCDFYGCAAEDIFNIIGSTPLHNAVTAEVLEIVKLLVRKGADVNMKDANELTPVHRTFAITNIWHIGNEMFNWTDFERSMMIFETPEMDRYRHAVSIFEHISEQLFSSKTSKESINSDFSIHQRPSNNARSSFSFKSGETLLQQGVDILAKQDNGSIWLFDKLKYPYVEDIEFILAILRQDDIIKNRLKQEFGWTTLHVACSLFNVDLAKESLDVGIEVNSRTSTDSPIYPGCTPLHILMMSLDGTRSYHDSKEEYEILLQILLDNGADVTLTDVNNDTPLHRSDYSRFWTSRSFKDSIYTNLLLEHLKNFDVNPVNNKGISVFHLACLKRNHQAVVEFLKRGVDVNQPVDFFAFDAVDMDEFTGCTPLHMAVKQLPKSPDVEFSLEVVELLLMHGADLNLEDAFGDTPLHVAAAADVPQKELLELLVSKGADIYSKNVSGKTPLEVLLYSRRISTEEVEVFLKQGCRLNVFNASSQVGYLALLIRYAKTDGQLKKSLELAMKCPSVNEVDDMGRTAIHNIAAYSDFAQDDGDLEIIENLMRCGADIDHQDQLGRTALHVAAQFRSYEAVRELLSSGADVNIVDANGQTAFAYALNPDTCLVDLTLDFNVSKNKHLVLDVFAEYIYNMLQHNVYVNEINRQAQTRAIDEFRVRMNEISSSFENLKNEKIGSASLILDDFMSETGAVVAYPKKSQIEREEIEKFFTVTIKEYRFYEWRFLCKLQYRKALARSQLVEFAKDAMNVIIDFPLPYLCFDVIQQFLTNADLKNLIATIT